MISGYHRPKANAERLKNTYVNGLVFKYDGICFMMILCIVICIFFNNLNLFILPCSTVFI